jgi:hypothetical protein
MSDQRQTVEDATPKPRVVHPGPRSIDDLLRYTDPAPDEETERFVDAIYADRSSQRRTL